MSDISTSLLSGFNNVSNALQSNRSNLTETEPETSFASVLSDSLGQYSQLNQENDLSSLELLSGNSDDLSTVMITAEKAEIALNLTVAIRNKAVDAYKEIMNMQI